MKISLRNPTRFATTRTETTMTKPKSIQRIIKKKKEKRKEEKTLSTWV